MDNLFLKYMDDRYEKTSHQEFGNKLGPVITISRECGCSANVIAEALTDKINQYYHNKGLKSSWRWISKEILAMAANELKIHPEKVKQLLDSKKKSVLSEFVDSFTDAYYAHGARIKKVTEDVVRSLAEQGSVVLVGRGSSIIAADIPGSLHIQLVAPLSWRISMMGLKKNLTLDESKKYVLRMDKMREDFKQNFLTKGHEAPDYDLSFNCKTLSVDQICEVILAVAIKKGLV